MAGFGCGLDDDGGRFGPDEGEELAGVVAGCEVVVEPSLAGVVVGQVEVGDVGALGDEVAGECVERGSHGAFAGDVGVEREDDEATVEGDVVEVREGGLPAVRVLADPRPDAGDRDAREVCEGGGVGLLDALGDPERDGGVVELGADSGRDVDAVALSGGGLVLDGAFGAGARVVGPVLVSPGGAVLAERRDQQARHAPSGGGDPERLEADLGVDGDVAARSGVVRGDAGRGEHPGVLREERAPVGCAHHRPDSHRARASCSPVTR